MSKTRPRPKVNLNDNPLAAFTKAAAKDDAGGGATLTATVTDAEPSGEPSGAADEPSAQVPAPTPARQSAASAAAGQKDFLVRLPADLHALLRLAGFEQNESMKAIAIRGLTAELDRMGYRPDA